MSSRGIVPFATNEIARIQVIEIIQIKNHSQKLQLSYSFDVFGKALWGDELISLLVIAWSSFYHFIRLISNMELWI